MLGHCDMRQRAATASGCRLCALSLQQTGLEVESVSVRGPRRLELLVFSKQCFRNVIGQESRVTLPTLLFQIVCGPAGGKV